MSHSIINLSQQILKAKLKSDQDFIEWQRKLAVQLKIAPPSKVEILNLYKNLRQKKRMGINFYFEKQLKKRPVRSLSGVAVVSVLTKPWPCPGRCIYCPKESGIPKSYLSGEPAVERAKFLKYDPYNQVKKRIEALERTGHPTDKIELIVIGGTWSYLPRRYQKWFIKRCLDGANDTGNGEKSKIKNKKLKIKIKNKKISGTLEEAQKLNEKAKHRIVGITLETRPDYITPQEILRMRQLGCTRVEIGVQTIDDKILSKNQRGHGAQEIIWATKLLKDAGFKVCYHLMPGLPGSTPQKDIAVFQKIFSNPNFQPDLVKIYPCVVTKGSKLYKIWQQKKYKPYSDKQLIALLIKLKSIIPPYVRIIRVVRDIPSFKIEGGSKISNLREAVQKEMIKRHLRCQCIRCREIKNLKIKNLELKRREYLASDGKEIFISFEDATNDKLAAFLRLRLPKNHSTIRANSRVIKIDIYKYFPELKNTALIREVHTYGELVPIHLRPSGYGRQVGQPVQHTGLGKKLIADAERIAQRSGYAKIAVIAGIGVRQYYRKLGYKLKNTYMIKNL